MTEEATSSDSSSSKCENQVILLGSADVGKTSLFYCLNGNPKTSKPTPPIPNHCEPFIDYKGEKVQMKLYDPEDGMSARHYEQLTRSYYKDSIVALLVYSADDIRSVSKLPDFIQKVKLDAPKAKMFLVRNKCDKEDASVSMEEAMNKLKQSGYYSCISKKFITSATEGTGIDELLNGIAKVLLEAEAPERKTCFKVYHESKQQEKTCSTSTDRKSSTCC